MRRYLFTFLLLVSTVSLVTFLADRWWRRMNQPQVLCPGCNVVIVDLDTLRADAMDCEGEVGEPGYPQNLCNLVQNSFKFENNFSQANWTLPSMVSTHTGLYPPEHGIPYLKDVLSENILTMPSILKENSYLTARAGNMGKSYTISSDTQTDRGYDLSYMNMGYELWPMLLEELMNFGLPIYTFLYFGEFRAPYLLSENTAVNIPDLDKLSFPIIYKDTLKLFQEYLLVNFSDSIGDKLKFDDIWDQLYNPFIYSIYQSAIDIDSNLAIRIKEIYQADIEEWDTESRDLMSALKDLKFSQNSIIVVMSDHGESFNEHGYLEHVTSPGSQYNELLRVPLYIYIPGIKGKTIPQISSNIDIFPTIFEILGIDDSEVKNKIHGRSLVPLMAGNKFWDKNKERYTVSFSRSLGSVQNSRYKMIFDLLDDDRAEIYDLSKDPLEKNNIIGNSRSVKRLFMKKLRNTFGFDFKGLGIGWEERFGESFN